MKSYSRWIRRITVRIGGGTGRHRGVDRQLTSPANRSIRPVLWAVASVSLAVNVCSLLTSGLWLYPDSRWYLELAVGLVDRWDTSQELFLVRPIGYPLLLGAVFSAFERNSPIVLQWLQHGMVVGTCVLVAWIGWRVSRRRAVALIGGMLAAVGLNLPAYANLVMVEVSFALISTTVCAFSISAVQHPGIIRLLTASLLVALASSLRPIGLALFVVPVLAAVLPACLPAVHAIPPGTQQVRRRVRRLVAAAAPCALVMYTGISHGTAGRTSDRGSLVGAVLYHRTAHVEHLDDPLDPSLTAIKATVERAKREGWLQADARWDDWITVWRAYQKTQQASLASVMGLLGNAGAGLALGHPRVIAVGTLIHAGRTLLMPDGTNEVFPPGIPIPGAPGEPGGRIHTATFEPELRQLMGSTVFERFLPLSHEPGAGSPIMVWYTNAVNNVLSAPLWHQPLGDSVYEFFVFACLAGAAYCLLRYRNAEWLVLLATIGAPLTVSAFLAGTEPRYAVPIRPLFHLFGIMALVDALHFVARAARRHAKSESSIRNRWSFTESVLSGGDWANGSI